MVSFESERVLDLSPWGLDKAIVKRFSAKQKAELNRAISKSNNIKIRAREDEEPDVDLDPSYEHDIIWATFALKEAPFNISRESLGEQDAELVEFISLQAQEVNSYFFLKPKEKEKAAKGEGPSDISLSLPSDSVISRPLMNAHVTSSPR
jgi:hypothetical protein